MRSRMRYVSIVIASGVGVAERWRSQYQKEQGWSNTVSGNSQIVYDKLCALGHNPSIEAVAEIIGNKGWCYIMCDGCTDYVEKAVALGEYEPKSYCNVCITEAMSALNA